MGKDWPKNIKNEKPVDVSVKAEAVSTIPAPGK